MLSVSTPKTLGALALSAAAALAVAGCGSSHASSAANASASAKPGTFVGTTAITRAASVSGAAQGEKVAFSFTEQLPTIGKLAVSGTGSYNRSPAAGAMNLHLSVPNASSLGSEAGAILSNLSLQAVYANSVAYLKVPSSLATMASTFTGGKPWVSVDLTKLAAGSPDQFPGLSKLLNAPTSTVSPTSAFQKLQQASSSGVAKVGTATVNGVATTEYSGTLNLAKLASTSKLTAAQRAAVKRSLTRSAKAMGVSTIPYDVYIDGSNLIRRLTISFSPSLHGTTVPITAQIDMLAYGRQPAPTVPAAGQTDDVTSLLAKAATLGMSSGSSTGSTGSSSIFGG